MFRTVFRVGAAVALASLMVPAAAHAQSKGDVEVFLGASYFSLDLPAAGETMVDDRLGMWGIHGQIVFYFNDNLGLVLDGAFPQGTVTVPVDDRSVSVDFAQSNYLGGIQYRFGAGDGFTPSLQGLIGWYSGSVGTLRVEGIDQPVLIGLDENGFSASVGANLDIQLSQSFALRILHAGVVWTSYGDRTQTNPRASLGIVGRF